MSFGLMDNTIQSVYRTMPFGLTNNTVQSIRQCQSVLGTIQFNRWRKTNQPVERGFNRISLTLTPTSWTTKSIELVLTTLSACGSDACSRCRDYFSVNDAVWSIPLALKVQRMQRKPFGLLMCIIILSLLTQCVSMRHICPTLLQWARASRRLSHYTMIWLRPRTFINRSSGYIPIERREHFELIQLPMEIVVARGNEYKV